MFSPLLVPRPYRVIDRIDEVPDIRTLHVVPVQGALPTFTPAQVSMVGVFGVGEAAISISSAVDNHDYHAYTIRGAGPISNALIETPVGGTVLIRGPFGTAWPLDEVATSELLFVGGGLGIAPLRAAIEHAATSSAFDQVSVLYGAKRPSLLVYPEDLDRWEENGVDVLRIVDQGTEEWDGAVGVVPDLIARDDDREWTNVTAFVCGPDIMMHYAALRLQEKGVAAENIWLTLERNMQCGNALCGHCQLGPFIVCRDGPVTHYPTIKRFTTVPSL